MTVLASGHITKTERQRGHHFAVRVYYEDTDAAGIVYYANYLKFAERARTEMMRDLGADHSELHRQTGLAFVVKRCVVDYRYPARLDEMLDVQTLIGRVRGASLDLTQRIFRSDLLLVSIEVKLALVDESLRAARLPPVLIAALTPQYRVGT